MDSMTVVRASRRVGCASRPLSSVRARAPRRLSSAASSRIGELTAQGPGTPLWGGRTISSTREWGFKCRFVLWRGDGPDDGFAVYVRMSKFLEREASIGLYSTERPQGDDGGVAGSPQAAALARTRMGSDSWLIPDLKQAISKGPHEWEWRVGGGSELLVVFRWLRWWW